jgi:hypothetical protein
MNELAPLRRAERPDATWPAGCAQRGYASMPALVSFSSCGLLDLVLRSASLESLGQPAPEAVQSALFLDRNRPSYIGGTLEMANYPAPGRGSSETSTLKRSGSSSELGWASEPATATRR